MAKKECSFASARHRCDEFSAGSEQRSSFRETQPAAPDFASPPVWCKGSRKRQDGVGVPDCHESCTRICSEPHNSQFFKRSRGFAQIGTCAAFLVENDNADARAVTLFEFGQDREF